ncbi:hypothetical protein ACIQVO_19690 [Streptomyces sp. NPDC101062]|uniref:hypothetical protein n=1 Tax=unclassified Streptomyces TaxID=2593676 RepID=UPI0038032063
MSKLTEYDTTAGRRGLGDRRSVHRVHRGLRWMEILLVPAAMAGVIAYLTLKSPFLYVPVVAGLVYAGFAGLRRIPPAEGVRMAVVYEGGVLLGHPRSQPVTYAWQEIDSTGHDLGESDIGLAPGGFRTTERAPVTAIWPAGREQPVVLAHVVRQNKLAEALEAGIRPRLLERLRATLDTEGSVRLGDLEVTDEGVTLHSGGAAAPTVIEWPELAETTTFGPSRLRVRTGTGRCDLPVRNAATVRDFVEETRELNV